MIYIHCMRVILAGGGTGGHVIPALAIAQELVRSYQAEVQFVGTPRGIENRLVPAAGFPLQLVKVGALKNVSLTTRLKTSFDLPRAIWSAGRILNEFRADVDRLIGRVIDREHQLGIRPATRHPNFNFGAVMAAWSQGSSFADLADLTNASDGDLVRTLRLTVQLLRQIRKAIPHLPQLAEKLGRCIELVNRDAVDAKRQLELG